MASSETVKMADTGRGSVCNAEFKSESGSLKRSTVLRVLARQRSTVENLQTMAGLFPDSPCKFKRERWEITCGKILLLSELAGEISALPDESENLMGEKPSLLPFLVAELAQQQSKRAVSLAAAVDPSSGIPSFQRERFMDKFTRADEMVSFLEPLIDKFSGNAEEQPGPREESPAPIGEKPCDGAGGESIPPAFHPDLLRGWLAGLDSSALALAFEAARLELEKRGSILHWSLSGY